MFSTGDLEQPVLFDNINGIPLVQASVEGRYYPNFINYQNMGGTALNQSTWGGCYFCTSVNWCKYWVWRHTGKKLSMSRGEAMDAAADGRGIGSNRTQDDIEGGGISDANGLFLFNEDEWQAKHKWSSGKSELITEFLKICNKNGINSSNIVPGVSLACTKDNVIKAINTYGPFYWSHDPSIYSSTTGSHAILGMGYDYQYFYFKGSWSGSEDDHSYQHYGKIEWSKFGGNGIRCYTNLIFKNL